MFKGLTQRAQRILTILSQEEARRAHSDQLFPEHIVLAILKEGEGTACRALHALKIDLMDFRQEIERQTPHKKGGFVFGDVPPSRRTRSVLESAADEARALGHDHVGTEHLFVAASREEDSAVERYLNRFAIDIETLRSALFTGTSISQAQSAGLPGPTNQNVSGGGFASSSRHLEGNAGEPDSRDSSGFSTAAPTQAEQTAPQKGPILHPSQRTPYLDEFSRDLTDLARVGKLDPVVGRTKEIGRVVRILARRTKNNPVLIGEPGVGKTAIVEGLAGLISSDQAPRILSGKRVVTLDIASVVAGTKYRGEFEERLKKIMKEILQAGNIILFIDELHTVIGAGGAEGTIDAANMLKPALSRGELQCIGATTLAEYRKHFEKDAALERRFQSVLIEEPDLDGTIAVLHGIRARYEDHHRVAYTDKAIEAAARLAQRYVAGRFMPDKAIDLLDEAGAKRKLETDTRPAEIGEIENEIQRMTREKAELVSSQDYERAAELRDEVRLLRSRLDSIREAWELASQEQRPVVEESDVRRVVSEITGIPLARLEESESRRLLNMEKELHANIVGQDEAVKAVSSAIRRSRAGISSPRRPLGSFIFLGPTGVGKTLLAKGLAEYLFGNEDALVRIDMSDFMEKHNSSRLIGAPPGYIGYEEGGTLTERIRRNPYRVVLFDEIEKAHRDVFNLLLQVLEEGELKDNLGHTVSFRNTVIIMTSNAGAREISRDARLGFNASAGIMDVREIRDSALSELKRLFNPEFINRIDDIVVFHALDKAQVESVFNIQIGELRKRLADRSFSLELSPAARNILVEKGYDPKFGARPMRRVIQRDIEDPLSLLLLGKDYPSGSVFVVGVKGKDLDVRVRKSSRVLAAPVAEVQALPASGSGAKGAMDLGTALAEAIKLN